MERSILCVVCSESMCWALVRPACSHHRNMRRSIAFSLQSGLHQLAADASQCSTSGRGSRQSACKLLNSASSRLYESASPEVSAQYHQPCPAQHQDSRTSSSEATGNGGMSGRSNRTSFMSSSCTCTSQSVPHGSGHGMQLRGFAASAATIAITEAATPKAAGECHCHSSVLICRCCFHASMPIHALLNSAAPAHTACMHVTILRPSASPCSRHVQWRLTASRLHSDQHPACHVHLAR